MVVQRVGGRIEVTVNGERFDAKGSYSYNPGTDLREAVVGADGIHGFKTTPQVPMIEGVTTDRADLDTVALTRITGATVALRLPNGKVAILRDAWYAADGKGTTEEGEYPLKFEGRTMEIVGA